LTAQDEAAAYTSIMKPLAWLVLICAAAIALTPLNSSLAQEKVDSVVGAVTDIDKANKKVMLKTDAGVVLSIQTNDDTVCLRLPAGERTLSKATATRFDEIAINDRILAHGTRSDQTFSAQRLIVMPVAEVARKREHDLDEWKRRGIGGIVREVNAQAGEITLELRSPNPGSRIPIETSKAEFRHYVAGSLRFEDAQRSKIDEVRVGDQLRALGDKDGDANRFVAEQIVSGAFKTIGVTVSDVDPRTGQMHATTLDQKQAITISVNKDSVLRRISPPVATAIAQKAKAATAKSSPPQAAQKPVQPVIDVQQMIDTLPAISVNDIKTGDVLAVTGAVERDDTHLVAIKVAAGVDLVLKALAPPPGKPQVVRLSAGLPTVFDFSVIPIN
jgi:hypothetical protein